MMLVMFAVGVMNVIWMAALGVVMTIEKISSGKRVTYLTGAALGSIMASVIAPHINATTAACIPGNRFSERPAERLERAHVRENHTEREPAEPR